MAAAQGAGWTRVLTLVSGGRGGFGVANGSRVFVRRRYGLGRLAFGVATGSGAWADYHRD